MERIDNRDWLDTQEPHVLTVALLTEACIQVVNRSRGSSEEKLKSDLAVAAPNEHTILMAIELDAGYRRTVTAEELVDGFSKVAGQNPQRMKDYRLVLPFVARSLYMGEDREEVIKTIRAQLTQVIL